MITAHIIRRNDLKSDLSHCGSLLFFLGTVPQLKTICDGTHAKEWSQYVISKSKTLNEWSPDILHTTMGIVYAINNLCQNNGFNYDEEYSLSLLKIATDIRLHNFLLPVLINDQSLLIHGISEYFVMTAEKYVRWKRILSDAKESLESLRQRVKCPLTRRNLSIITDETYGSNGVRPAAFPDRHRRNTALSRREKDRVKIDQDLSPDIAISEGSLDIEEFSRIVVAIAMLWKTILKFWRISLGKRDAPKKRLVISCSRNFSPVHMQKHLEERGYLLSILYNDSSDAERDKLLSDCTCFIVCIDEDYSNEETQNLNVAYKRTIPIIPAIFDEDEANQTDNPLLRHILERHGSSKNIVKMRDFEQGMEKLLLRIAYLPFVIDVPFRIISHSLIAPPLEELPSDPPTVEPSADKFYCACRKGDVETVRMFLKYMRPQDIDRYQEDGSTALHTAAYYGHDEIVRLLLEKGASPSIKHHRNGLKPYEQARFQRTKDVFCHYRDHSKHRGISVYDRHTPWIHASPQLKNERKFLREKLSKLVPETNVNQDEMYEEIVDSMNRYVGKLPLENSQKERIMQCLSTMRRTKDPLDLVRCYSTTTPFHRHFNELLAKHSTNYFDDREVNLHDDYRTIGSVLRVTAMLMFLKTYDRYRHTGLVHRGMPLSQEELKKYQVGSEIMCKSWLSTSKSSAVAKNFGGSLSHQTTLDDDSQQTNGIPVICTYLIKDERTAMDIRTMSDMGRIEEEVLILPYSVFKVTDVEHVFNDHVKITLEEVMENETDD